MDDQVSRQQPPQRQTTTHTHTHTPTFLSSPCTTPLPFCVSQSLLWCSLSHSSAQKCNNDTAEHKAMIEKVRVETLLHSPVSLMIKCGHSNWHTFLHCFFFLFFFGMKWDGDTMWKCQPVTALYRIFIVDISWIPIPTNCISLNNLNLLHHCWCVMVWMSMTSSS